MCTQEKCRHGHMRDSRGIEQVVRLSCVDGKKWVLPDVVHFVGTNNSFYYGVLGYRPPKAGEWYLSGAIVEAYKAIGDLKDPYLVILPTERAVLKQVWVPAEEGR